MLEVDHGGGKLRKTTATLMLLTGGRRGRSHSRQLRSSILGVDEVAEDGEASPAVRLARRFPWRCCPVVAVSVFSSPAGLRWWLGRRREAEGEESGGGMEEKGLGFIGEGKGEALGSLYRQGSGVAWHGAGDGKLRGRTATSSSVVPGARWQGR